MSKIKIVNEKFEGGSARGSRELSGEALNLAKKVEAIVNYKYFTVVINDERTDKCFWCKIPVNTLLQRLRVTPSRNMIAKPFGVNQAYKLIDEGRLVYLCDLDEIDKFEGASRGEKVQNYLEKRFKIKFDRTVCDLDGAEWRGTEVKFWSGIKSSADATFPSTDTINNRYDKIK